MQETWLRLRRVEDPSAIRDLPAWLIRTVGRLALGVLDSARARRERYVGTWLPEPLVENVEDPAQRVTLDESVSMALLVVLERLSPAQRTAFLLHDVFRLPFEEIASIVGRTPVAVRRLASQPRRHVEQGGPRFPPTRTEQGELVAAFPAAALVHPPPASLTRPALVNGAPGLVVRDADGILQVIAFTVDAGHIVAVAVVRNPDKLTNLAEGHV